MKNKKTVISGLSILTALGSGYAFYKLTKDIANGLMYRHHKDEDYSAEFEQTYPYQDIYIRNNQKIKLRGLLIERVGASKTILILHPFKKDAKAMSPYIEFFAKRYSDYNILAIDSISHGQSDGYLRGFGLKEIDDLSLWCNYLIDNYGENHKIIIYGKEAGASLALNAAGQKVLRNVVAIISDGAFTSFYDLLKHRVVHKYKLPVQPTVELIRRRIHKEIKLDIKKNTVNNVRHNDIPTIYIHTKGDKLVPINMVYALYNATRANKVLFILKEEEFLYELIESDEYKKTLDTFLNKIK